MRGAEKVPSSSRSSGTAIPAPLGSKTTTKDQIATNPNRGENDAGHADENHADAGAVVVVAELFESGSFEPVGFIHDQELGTGGAGSRWRAVALAPAGLQHEVDGAAEPVAQQGDLLVEFVRGAVDLGGVHDGADGQDVVGLGRRGRSLPVEVRGELVPAGVGAGGFGLADAGPAVAQADVALAADGFGELAESAVLLGHHERRGCRLGSVRRSGAGHGTVGGVRACSGVGSAGRGWRWVGVGGVVTWGRGIIHAGCLSGRSAGHSFQ
jgi:hypothetical protein